MDKRFLPPAQNVLHLTEGRHYNIPVQSTFDGVAGNGLLYTGYRIDDKSVFFLSGAARKTMNEYISYHWRDHTAPIRLRFSVRKNKKFCFYDRAQTPML